MLKSFLLALLAGLQLLVGGGEASLNSSMMANSLEASPQVAENQVSFESRPVAQVKPVVQSLELGSQGSDFVKKLKDSGITLHPGSEFTRDSVETPGGLQHCASLVYQTLRLVPSEAAAKVKNLTLYFNATGRRGLGGGSTIILRCQNVSDEELVGVLVHELGHVEDTGVLLGDVWSGESAFKDGKNPVYNNDVSLDFYKISFSDEKTLKKSASELDFVSGYAMTDPFEDFAESFNYYLLHGDDFRLLAASNDALLQKYNFLKEKVFGGKEYNFESADDSSLLATRHYDSTLIGYNLDKFLAI